MAAFYESVVRVLLRQTLFPPLKYRIKIRILVYATGIYSWILMVVQSDEKMLVALVGENSDPERIGG